ncbi:Acetylxylan esterase precursor [Limihaloglobus sulfuriphilus]|uniref:Acetylxylan esterase n=1 Tax=Limihaloglobus sulfuriphilus TaxID=1851148 RepID=A0A1Q2MH11_9BACT|nr:alpha/beta hydrolase [Limihaloglobus sulfuriphilus]AQQ71597.1 Acetylxylan esterase precursor [Limihaloglobus sulfuriphilus]
MKILSTEYPKKLALAAFCLVLAGVCGAETLEKQENKMTLQLWQSEIPFSKGGADADIPSMDFYPAPAQPSSKAAVIVCPGGGYARLADDHEGVQIAEWLNSIGINAFVLTYRLPANGYRHPVPLADAQRTIRTVRSNAEKWDIDPKRIGILGFSAGGHLASSAGTHFNDPVKLPGKTDPVDAVSCRPDFQVLIYPVISMKSGIGHMGSRQKLLGSDPEPELVELMSNEMQVRADTPPAFLVHAGDDKGVLPQNSLLFYQACLDAGVAAEMHIYLKGGHGFGTRPQAGPASQWPAACEDWMKEIGVLSKE